ncbi:MAG: hypothetical protein ACPL6D_09255, partial [Thermodesulfobacteriota bacterium]
KNLNLSQSFKWVCYDETIPMFLFRPLFEKHYLNQVPNIVVVNLSRLAAQWENRINKAIEEMKKQALKYVQDELATIESLLFKAHRQTDEIRQTMEKLKGELKQLMDAERSINIE